MRSVNWLLRRISTIAVPAIALAVMLASLAIWSPRQVGYVTMNTRDRDEVTAVEDAERLVRQERRRSDDLIAQGRHEEATLVIPAGYYWKWSGQFESQQRATRRLSIVVPLVL